MGSSSPEEEDYETGLQHPTNMPCPQVVIHPFAGRIGGNQGLVLNRTDPENEALLKKVPDAAPLMTLREGFCFNGFKDIDLWKFGFIECMGTMMHTFLTVWVSIRGPLPDVPTAAGVFGTPRFFGPLVGGICNFISLAVFIFSFASTSGSHLNPTITMATFFARLISFPRMVIYLMGQIIGGTLAGLMLREAYGSRDFTVGGCVIDTDLVPVRSAFTLEFIFTLTLLFLSFGVGLDPRQGKIYGPALSPFLVGAGLGLISWGSSFTRDGYAGAGLNPARCFGVYTATAFPHYHWIHWVGPIAASMGHGVVYFLVPPWSGQ